MHSIQVDETIQKIMQIFYRIGLWQSEEESNYRKISRKFFYTFFGVLFPIFFAINAFLCDDRNESFFSLQIAIIVGVMYVKFQYLLFNKQEIIEFLFDPTVVRSIEYRDEYNQMRRKIEKFMKFVRPYCLMIYITAALLIVSKLPILSSDKGLPLFISFSWNDSEIVYWLAYLYVSLLIFLFDTANLITVLIWYVMLNYSIEINLLGNKLRKLGVRKEIIKDSPTERSVYVDDLVVLIKDHRKLSG